MSLSDRDRKIMLFIAPVAVLLAYWFLVLSPQRKEATALGAKLTKVESQRDKAVGEATAAEHAKSNYSDDLATIIRVGKAVPSTVDMPSLIVQLNHAAKNANIRFERISTGERSEATPAAAPAPAAAGSTPAASGGTPAQSGPGKAAEKANETKDTADARSGAAPAGSAATPAAGTSGVPGLDTIPLEFTFRGSFFNLADLFHQMKRFVRLSNQRLVVKGRLMSIDTFTLDSSSFPSMKAEMTATVYLAPKTEGTTGGATPSGPAPAGAPQAASSGTPAAPPAATAAAR